MSAYSSNTRIELIALCKERGIPGYSTQNKDGLIALLEGCSITPVKKQKRRVRIIPDDEEITSSGVIVEDSHTMPLVTKKTVKKPVGGAGASTGGLSQWISTSEPTRVYENKIEVLPVVDVETVRLVLFEYDGKTYYRDPNKNKLFARKGPKSIGPYIGRWDSQHECIVTDVADSDAD